MERTHAQATPKKRAARTTKTKREDPEIKEFLDRFGRAVTSGDTRTIATMWGTPALVLSDSDTHAVASPEQVEQFFAGAKDQYNARGITDTRPDIVRFEWLTERIAIVDVRWPYLDAQGREHGDETSTYTLRRDGDGLKLYAVVMRGERPKH